jgi:hypothetical protein
MMIAAFFTFNSSAAKLAATVPWKGSIKQVRKTYSFTLPFLEVISGLVPVGVTNTTLLLLANSTWAKVLVLVAAPTIKETLSWLINFTAPLVASAASDLLSNSTNSSLILFINFF